MALFGKKIDTNEVVILSPVDGKVKPLKQVKDEVFAGEMVGKGVAVVPTSSTVYSPAAGKVTVAFPTGHAYGIQIPKVADLLVHIGVDTVALNGEGFDMKASVGKAVKTTTPLADIDLDILNKKAPASDIIVVVTNDTIGDYKITNVAKGDVKAGDPLFTLKK